MHDSFYWRLKKDTNFETCKKLITSLLENNIDWSVYIKDSNYKDHIQRVYHKRKYGDPNLKH